MDGQSIQRVRTIDRNRGSVLFAIYLGALMTWLDGPAVNVALPFIRTDLGFTENSLVWVFSGYTVAFGGLLLACGRLADHFGHHRIFLTGITLFTMASIGCALAGRPELLIGGRVIQGGAGAAIAAVSFSLIVHQFDDKAERARALGIYSCLATCGGIAGLLLGGILTSAWGWRSIFLVNLPIGILIAVLYRSTKLTTGPGAKRIHFDSAGAVTITTSMILAIASILSGSKLGWLSVYVLIPLCASLMFFLLFIGIETRSDAPLVPAALFKHHDFRTSTIAGALWSAGQSTWVFVTVLNLALLLGHDAWKIGLAFLPSTILAALLSVFASAKLTMWLGTKPPLVAGLLCQAAGFLLFARAPPDASFAWDFLPGMLLVGVGSGITIAPLRLSALTGLREGDYGVASGIINSCTVLGAALGPALNASLATTRTGRLMEAGVDGSIALHSGYSQAYLVGGFLVIGAALISMRIGE